MSSTSAKHFEAINHGKAVMVPLKERGEVINVRFNHGDAYTIKDIEQKWQFEYFPDVEIKEVDSIVEVERHLLKPSLRKNAKK